VHAGFAAERVCLQAGVVGDDNLARRKPAVVLSLLARVAFKRGRVFDDAGQGSEAGQRENFHARSRGGPGEIAQLAGIRGGDEKAHASMKYDSRFTKDAPEQLATKPLHKSYFVNRTSRAKLFPGPRIQSRGAIHV